MLASLVRALVLLAAGGAVGLGVNAVRKDRIALRTVAQPVSCEAAAEPVGTPQELLPVDAAALCGRSDVVVADTRPAPRFAEGHVAGALHLPCDAAGPVASEALSRLVAAHTVIVYGEATDDALPVAASLRRRGLPRVMVLRGGFGAWSQAGQACASGPCDDCKASVP